MPAVPVYDARMAKRVDRFSELVLRGLAKIFGSTVRRQTAINKNAPCPCGSGLKYKRCCLPKEQAAKAPAPGRRKHP